MQNFLRSIMDFFNQLGEFGWIDVLDIIIVTVVIYQLLKLTRETRAQQVIKGFGVLILAAQICDWANLSAISWLLDYIVNAGAIVLVILFQPELRQALERIGRGKLFEKASFIPTESNNVWAVDEIIRAMQNLVMNKIGAIVVIQQKSPLGDILSSGTRIEARVSSELLENLFVPNTPLHDGAVIIQGGTLLAAGCFLPMSANPDISQNLGSRHRAALGISEISDALVIVASEETGIISVAQEGKLIRYLDGSGLRSILMAVYAPDQAQKGINSLLHWRSRHEKRT
ncbi:MAG: TIGR00159 family protein [Clostridiales bacterium]|nr:TIGR00159 family protein [Clostridiales bacterium]